MANNNDRVNAAIDNLIVALNELKSALAEQDYQPETQVIISDAPPAGIDEMHLQRQFEEAAREKENVPASAGIRFCHMCGAELIPGDRFCINCGTPVEL